MQVTITDITALHKKYAPTNEIFNLVFTHCQIVCDMAEKLIEKNNLPVDRELVRTGALLHDIGAYPLFDISSRLREGVSYITHGAEGEKILQREGFSEEVWRFASHHTGVGISKQDVVNQKLPLPIRDYFAASEEELLIMYADKFHSKTTPPYFNSFEWYANDVAKFGQDKVQKFEEMASRFGVPDIEWFSKKYGHSTR